MKTAEVIIVCELIGYFKEAILEIYDVALSVPPSTNNEKWDAIIASCEFALSKFGEEFDVDPPK